MKQPKNIVITGSSSGIGAALALFYARQGARLYLFGRDEARLKRVADTCNATMHVADVRDAAAMHAMLTSIDAQTPVDLVIANAGISAGSGTSEGSMFDETLEQAKVIFDVNVQGVVNTVYPLIAPMRARKRGQIAMVSSLAGFRGIPGAAAYSASKAAVRAYGIALRGALKQDNVEVNVICPGFIDTPMTKLNPYPMPFLMTPEQGAAVIAQGLERNKAVHAFPLALYAPLFLARLLPVWMTDPIFTRMPSKPAL